MILVSNTIKVVQRGFTLIEISIVLVISSLLIGIVGPLTVDSLERTSAKQELVEIKDFIRKVAWKSYLEGSTYRLDFKGKQVDVFNREILIKKHSLEYVFFREQSIMLNQHGFTENNVLEATVRKKQYRVELHKLLEQKAVF